MRRQQLVVGLVGGILLSVGMWAVPVWAQDPIHKAGRGVVNVLTGWIEIPKQFHQGSQEENPVAGAGIGLFRGMGLAILRGGMGLYEIATFPIPYPQNYASPYEQIEMTDYPWE